MEDRGEHNGNGRLAFALAFALALGLYLATLAPGVLWGDSADLALQVQSGKLYVGRASNHPLFVILGIGLATLPGDLALKLNLLAALCGAAAVACVQRIASRLAHSSWAGWAAAAALAFSHAFWLHSVMAGVRTLNAAFVALLLLLALEWRARGGTLRWLGIMILAFLVGLTNHLVLATVLPALVVFVILVRPPARSHLVGATALVVLALATTLLVPSFRTTVSSLWYGPPPIYHYFSLPTTEKLPRELAFYLAYLFYQFPVVGFALGIVGIRNLIRSDARAAVLLLLAAGVNALVFVKTTEWVSAGGTKYTFYIPDYVVFAVLVGLGARELSLRVDRRLLLACLVACPLVLYSLLPPILNGLGVDLVHARELPYRDNATYFLRPSKRGEDGPRRYGEEVLAAAAPGAAIVADFTPLAVLRYLRNIEGLRRDVLLIASEYYNHRTERTDLLPLALGLTPDRPLYLAGTDPRFYNLHSLHDAFDVVSVGPLYQVVRRSSSGVRHPLVPQQGEVR
jgi:hypothetical protein